MDTTSVMVLRRMGSIENGIASTKKRGLESTHNEESDSYCVSSSSSSSSSPYNESDVDEDESSISQGNKKENNNNRNIGTDDNESDGTISDDGEQGDEDEDGDRKSGKLWTIEEDKLLMELYERLGSKWAVMHHHLPRWTRLQIKTRFKSLIRARNRMWKKSEDELLLKKCHGSKKKNWEKIARYFPGRTKNAVKIHYRFLIGDLQGVSNYTSYAPPMPGSPRQALIGLDVFSPLDLHSTSTSNDANNNAGIDLGKKSTTTKSINIMALDTVDVSSTTSSSRKPSVALSTMSPSPTPTSISGSTISGTTTLASARSTFPTKINLNEHQASSKVTSNHQGSNISDPVSFIGLTPCISNPLSFSSNLLPTSTTIKYGLASSTDNRADPVIRTRTFLPSLTMSDLDVSIAANKRAASMLSFALNNNKPNESFTMMNQQQQQHHHHLLNNQGYNRIPAMLPSNVSSLPVSMSQYPLALSSYPTYLQQHQQQQTKSHFNTIENFAEMIRLHANSLRLQR